MSPSAPRTGFLAPEVVQTSSMDCGPAVLKCLAAAYGLELDYGRLREACQTDLDGTSIDTLEEIANRLGLPAEQVLLPADHVMVPGVHVMPAIVVTRQADGTPHFVVAWSRVGAYVQVMDPATGRRWVRADAFLDSLYLHRTHVAAPAWRRWAAGEEYRAGLTHRLARAGVPAGRAGALLVTALADTRWRGIAALDAATRMTQALVSARAVRAGAAASRLLESLVAPVAGTEPGASIPAMYWPAVSLDAVPAEQRPPGAPAGEALLVRGAVVLRVRATAGASVRAPAAALSPELEAARAPSPSPVRALSAQLLAIGPGAMTALAAGVVFGAGTVVVEALLLRGMMQAGTWLVPGARAVFLGAGVAFFALLALVDWPVALGLAWLGRRLEMGLRVAFHEKLPRLGSRYFRSRPVSDMGERAHSLHALRSLPAMGAGLLRTSLQVLFTAAGIVWLFPGGWPLVLLATACSLLLPLVAQRALVERELRVRSHLGALGRFYLDALLGLVPVRTHGAERAVRREHAQLLGRWTGASWRFQRALVAAQGAQGLVALAVSMALLARHHAAHGNPADVLLLVYWTLALPALGSEVARLLAQAPLQRNVALRALEPLGALDEEAYFVAGSPATSSSSPPASSSSPPPAAAARTPGAAIAFRGVHVRLGAREVLSQVDLEIAAGEHVAIVGHSGAGKSTLLGCLLGWNRAAEGAIEADGAPLDGAHVRRLRAATAWVDAGVRLWNQPLRENLLDGSAGAADRLAWAIGEAELAAVVAALPAGLDTPLGEGGALVSGGEGQRVRLARALLRPGVRLALLDEPFRGLGHEQRLALMARARAHWSRATLLCVTHDLEETRTFDRVLVIEDGRVVEQGAPGPLASAPGSRYRALLDAQRTLQQRLWDAPIWRRLVLADGRIEEVRP